MHDACRRFESSRSSSRNTRASCISLNGRTANTACIATVSTTLKRYECIWDDVIVQGVQKVVEQLTDVEQDLAKCRDAKDQVSDDKATVVAKDQQLIG